MPDPIEGKAADSPAQPASPAAPAPSPAAAAKPAAKAASKSYEPPDKGRRRLIWALIFSYLGINLLLFLRFFFPRALYEPNTVFSVGYPSDFALGVNQQFLASNRIWIVREPGRVFTIFARCTHLGCTPEWKPSENKFKCPCHGSGYDSEGVNFEGPAPRPMDRAKMTLDATGKIIVDTSKLFMDDPRAGVNQFNDPGAFLSI
jgi:cytochrome b6-f complex iron-sulfur subunit